MKTFFIISALGLALMLSCGDSKTKNQEDRFNYPTTDPLLSAQKTEISTDTLNDGKQCFVAHIKRDSAFLSLYKTGNTIRGSLHYKFYEKDNTKGDLAGTLNGDTLELNYTFASEGTTSQKPIRFIYEKGNIYEIYGRKRPHKDSAFIYLPVDCL